MTWETELALQNTFLDFVNLSITASWVILAVLLLRAILTRVPKKYVCLLWFVVLFRLLCPVTIETDLSIIPQPSTITYEDVAYTTPKIETGSAAVNTVADYTINPVMKEHLAPSPATSVNPMQVYLFIATIVWMIGIAVLALYTVISWYKMRLNVRESVPEGGYYRCANISSPFVFGLLKPKIYLPYGLDGEAKDYVLLHEESHIARKDFIVKSIFWLAVMIHWMNPMVWIAWHYFSRDLELACDERAIDTLDKNQKSDYSNTLLNLAVQPKRFTCPVAFGNNSVKQRITHVLHYKGIPALARDTVVVLLAIVIIFLAVNPLKAGELDEYKAILSEDFHGNISKIVMKWGSATTIISDHEQIAELTEQLANIQVKENPYREPSNQNDVLIILYEENKEDYSSENILAISDNFEVVRNFEAPLEVKKTKQLRKLLYSYCQSSLQNYPDTTFYADLNHDGIDEMIIVNVDEWQENNSAELAVYNDNGDVLYLRDLNYAHAGWGNYFLYEKDGKEYLMEFMPSIYQGVANYSWKLYEFDENDSLVIAEENSVDFSINSEQYDFDIEPILNFLTEVEAMLNDATLLVSVDNFELQYSTVSEPKKLDLDYYLDWLDDTWTGEVNIGTTLPERLTNYQYSIYFDRPRQALIEWLVENKGMDITQQHLAGSQMIEIDGIDCAVFDLRWNEIASMPNGLIDRYAISVQNPDDFMDAINGRTYYLYNQTHAEWIELENSTDRIATDKLAQYWAETYVNRDGQGRYDMLSSDWQKKIDKLDEYESIGLDWMPYWTENKEALGLRGSSPWVENWDAVSYAVVDGKNSRHFIRITYDMMDSAQGTYVYEETIELGLEDDEWKVVDCYVSVNLLSTEIYQYAQDIVASLQKNTYEHKNQGSNISGLLQQGSDVWRLNPLEVTAKFVEEYLVLTDGYELAFDEKNNTVICHTNEQDYTIYLYKPIQRGDGTDFYAVSGYEYYYYDTTNGETISLGEKVLHSYYVGNNPWASLGIGEPTKGVTPPTPKQQLQKYLIKNNGFIEGKHILAYFNPVKLESYNDVVANSYEWRDDDTDELLGVFAVSERGGDFFFYEYKQMNEADEETLNIWYFRDVIRAENVE